eukprot:318395-Pelagomonas_calceolata.AAC.12
MAASAMVLGQSPVEIGGVNCFSPFSCTPAMAKTLRRAEHSTLMGKTSSLMMWMASMRCSAWTGRTRKFSNPLSLALLGAVMLLPKD